jgi:hypothetical protein
MTSTSEYSSLIQNPDKPATLIQNDSYHLLLSLLTHEQRAILHEHAIAGRFVAYAVRPDTRPVWVSVA